jgi:hypothetical protein
MANNNAMVLMYHNIGKPPLGSTLPKLYVSPWNFASQMAYLHYAGYQVVSLERIV